MMPDSRSPRSLTLGRRLKFPARVRWALSDTAGTTADSWAYAAIEIRYQDQEREWSRSFTMNDFTAEERERQEIAFWSDSKEERPGAFSADLLTHKMSEGRIFLEKLNQFSDYFNDASTIVELGGGQCWASCMVKAQVGPRATVIGTDIAPDAIASVHQWERVFNVSVDRTEACRSYSTPFDDDSVDLVFTFAAAHHFGAHRRTLGEVARILRPGGHALYLHEPGCRDWIYRAALKRVLAKRPVVPEDVLRYRHLMELAQEAGLVPELHYAPTTTYRGGVETVYYLGLQRLPPLQRLLPCTFDMVFEKPSAS